MIKKLALSAAVMAVLASGSWASIFSVELSDLDHAVRIESITLVWNVNSEFSIISYR